MIEVKKEGVRLRQALKRVDKERNILLLADGGIDYARCEIQYHDTVNVIKQYYEHESPLIKSFIRAKELGVPHVFVANIRNYNDIIKFAPQLAHHDFTYIVPIGLHLSSLFVDPRDPTKRKKTPYLTYMVEALMTHNRSVVLATDVHASLYEDIDVYLRETKNIERFTRNQDFEKHKLVFTLNNMKDEDYANLVLAAAMTSRTPSDIYPRPIDGETVFHIDELEIGQTSIVYFQDLYNRSLSIENLVNFERPSLPHKSVLTMAIVNKIHRMFNLNEFAGRFYRSNTEHLIRRVIAEEMDHLVGLEIESYRIQSIRFFPESTGVGRIEIEMHIKDIRTFETCVVLLEV